MPNQNFEIIILFIAVTGLILILAGFIVTILYLYQKRQLAFNKNLDEIKTAHERDLIKTELEIQEQTLVHVSKEIHDNIGLSLTLAKIKLNTLIVVEPAQIEIVDTAIEILSQAIVQLSDLSKSLDSDFIRKNGLLKGIETEIRNVRKLNLHNVEFTVEGQPMFFEKDKEVILFRIIQESINNLLKHSGAKKIKVGIQYTDDNMHIKISDNGKGFDLDEAMGEGCGLNNIMQRARILNGTCDIQTQAEQGTLIHLLIPY